MDCENQRCTESVFSFIDFVMYLWRVLNPLGTDVLVFAALKTDFKIDGLLVMIRTSSLVVARGKSQHSWGM